MMLTKNYKAKSNCRGMYEQEIIDKVLEERGIDDVEHFFNPTEEDLLPLESMRNINKAYRVLDYHITNNSKVGVLYDTDLDGITSGTEITRYLLNFVPHVDTFINEGKRHGLIGQDLKKYMYLDLLIIVDSLDSDVSQYRKLKENNIEIIILDHHSVSLEVPYDEYSILVTSNIDYDNPQLSGAGVVWKFCKYLDEQYLTDYADELIDLAACGLVADMMDMTVMENRYIVSEGLKQIYNPAIKKIVGSFDFNSTGISFSIAPLVNASNRMNCNESSVNAFLADNNKEVLKYVKELRCCKEEQNIEVDRLMPDVVEQCENQKNSKIIYAIIDTKYGISGLLGNKLLEKYQRPILVLKDLGDKYSGSMRAIGMDNFLLICNDSGLAKADGHELASGIEIKKDNFEKFLKYINKYLQEMELKDDLKEVDVEISASDITRNLVDKIKEIDRVSGEGFRPIRFLITDICDFEVGDMSKGKHLVLKTGDIVQFIKWNFSGSFDTYEDASLLGENVGAVISLDCGFFGRKFVLKAICDDLWEVA